METGDLKIKARETVDLFNLYDSSDAQKWRNELVEDIQFVNNAQWKLDISAALEANNQSTVVNNEMKPARDQVVGQLTENDPRWLASTGEL